MSNERTRSAEASSSTSRPAPADVLVIFGITGDLARVMTFRALYRLEKRGLLDCPIVGVAFDDWTIEHLIERAHDSIVATDEELDHDVFQRFTERLSYVHGDFADAATYEAVANQQIAAARARLGEGDVDALLNRGDTWVVK